MVRFGFRVPSVKRHVRNSLGLKAPRGWGWITNPRKAAYNRVSNRTTRGHLVLVVVGIAAVGFLVAAIAADATEKRRAFPGQPPAAEKQRVAAPTSWNKMVAEAFLEDAFSVVGKRTPTEVSGQSPVPPVPQQPNEFDRTTLMKALEKAEESIAQAVASEKTFKHNAALLAGQIEIVMGIASELKDADPDYRDNEDYQRFVQSMRDSAASMRSAGNQTSYEMSGVSFGRLKQSCDSCHRKFR